MSRSNILPCLALLLLTLAFCCVHGAPRRIKTGKETWSYVTVRDGAYMFFWLYYTTADVDYKTRPLVLWLQGGPGASSTGIGNFLEIGPQDEGMNNRTNAWTEEVNVLFVDNPVGTGFSYVNNTSLLANNNSAVADDLVSFMKGFLKKVPEFETVPLYIFAESYGGKMAVKFAQALRKAVEAQKIKCQLAGVALGDSWISPVDAVDSWGPYLYATSLIDSVGLSQINDKAKAVSAAVAAGSMHNATMLWSETEELVEKVTNGVNFYNILSPPENSSTSSAFEGKSQDMLENTSEPHPNHIMSPFINPEENISPAPRSHHKFSSRQIEGRDMEHIPLSSIASFRLNDTEFDLPRGDYKTHKPTDRATSTIKKNHYHWRIHKSRFNHRMGKHGHYKHDNPDVTWQPAYIEYLYKRRVGKISEVLDKLMNGPIKEKLKIIPQNVTWGGQSASVFDALSADFMASAVEDVEMLLNNTAIKVIVYNGQLDLIVDTPGVEKWVENLQWAGTKQWLAAPRKAIASASGGTAAFTKSYKNFSFYWIMDAGHMVPADNSDIALKVMKEVVGVKDH